MKKFAPPCFRCMLPILDDHTSAFGHDWHLQCFVCNVCTLDCNSIIYSKLHLRVGVLFNKS